MGSLTGPLGLSEVGVVRRRPKLSPLSPPPRVPLRMGRPASHRPYYIFAAAIKVFVAAE